MTTPHELAAQLGLSNPDHFPLESRWDRADKEPDMERLLHRRQGKTTRNILAALCHVKDTGQSVLFVAHNLKMAQEIERRARAFATKLGLDPRKIKSASATTTWRIGWNENQVFVDHVVHEHPLP